MIEIKKNGSGIHIKKSHKGLFTKYCNGKVTNECILKGKNSPDPKIRKRAIFAENARHFKHLNGGSILKIGGTLVPKNHNKWGITVSILDSKREDIDRKTGKLKKYKVGKRIAKEQEGLPVEELLFPNMKPDFSNIKPNLNDLQIQEIPEEVMLADAPNSEHFWSNGGANFLLNAGASLLKGIGKGIKESQLAKQTRELQDLLNNEMSTYKTFLNPIIEKRVNQRLWSLNIINNTMNDIYNKK